MDNEALISAFQAHTSGSKEFTRRMAINMADFFETTPLRLVQQLEAIGLLKRGSRDWFVTNGGFTKEHFEQARATSERNR